MNLNVCVQYKFTKTINKKALINKGFFLYVRYVIINKKGGRNAKDRCSNDFGGGGSVKPSQEKALH